MKKQKPPHKHAGLEIGSTDCPGCGAALPLKVNVNGCVYYYCNAPKITDESGRVTRRCKTRFAMGQDKSAELIEQFFTNKKDLTNDRPEPVQEQTQPAIGHNGGPPLDDDAGGEVDAAAPVPGRGRIGGAIKHFLTGD